MANCLRPGPQSPWSTGLVTFRNVQEPQPLCGGELLRAENAEATGRQTLTLMLLLYGSDNPESADFVLPV
jgi:hypothetical protein